MKEIKVIFYPPTTFLGKLVAWFGSSGISHGAFYVDGKIWESVSSGFISRPREPHDESRKNRFCRFNVSEMDESRLIFILSGWVRRKVKYNWLGILAFPFSWVHGRVRNRKFCSEAIHRALNMLSILCEASGKPNKDPGDVYLMCRQAEFSRAK